MLEERSAYTVHDSIPHLDKSSKHIQKFLQIYDAITCVYTAHVVLQNINDDWHI